MAQGPSTQAIETRGAAVEIINVSRQPIMVTCICLIGQLHDLAHGRIRNRHTSEEGFIRMTVDDRPGRARLAHAHADHETQRNDPKLAAIDGYRRVRDWPYACRRSPSGCLEITVGRLGRRPIRGGIFPRDASSRVTSSNMWSSEVLPPPTSSRSRTRLSEPAKGAVEAQILLSWPLVET
jgi:hypothetical protein